MNKGLPVLHLSKEVAVKPAFYFAFSRRLLLWSVLSVAFSVVVSGVYFVLLSLSLSHALKNLTSTVVASLLVIGLSLFSCGRTSANAGGNSFDRFRIGAKAERMGLSFLTAIALTFVRGLHYKLLPSVVLAHVAYRTMFSTTCPSIQTVPNSLSTTLLTSSKRALFDAGRLLVTCISGALMARILVEIACSLVAVANRTSSASLLRQICHGLQDALTVDALRTTIPFVFLSTTCMHFTTSMLAYSLTYPIDFAKVFPIGSEVALLDALLGPNPHAEVLLPHPDRQNSWMKSYEAYLRTLRTQLHTASTRDSFNELPIVPSLGGKHTVRGFLAQWVCSHAQSDLNRIVRYQRMRRQVFLSEEHWPRLLAAELGVIGSATVQIEAILSYLQDTPLLDDAPSPPLSLSHTSTTAPSCPAGQPPAHSLDIYSSAIASGMAQDTASLPSSSPLGPFWRYLSTSLGIPLRGDLATLIHSPRPASSSSSNFPLPPPPLLSRPALSAVLPSHALLISLFRPLFSQRLVLALETLSLVLHHALSEDVRGVSVACVSGVVCAFLRLDATMLRYLQVVQPSGAVRGTRVGKALSARLQSSSMRYATPEVAAVHKAVCEATWHTMRGYYDMLQEKDMPSELQATFRAHRQVALATWP